MLSRKIPALLELDSQTISWIKMDPKKHHLVVPDIADLDKRSLIGIPACIISVWIRVLLKLLPTSVFFFASDQTSRDIEHTEQDIAKARHLATGSGKSAPHFVQNSSPWRSASSHSSTPQSSNWRRVVAESPSPSVSNSAAMKAPPSHRYLFLWLLEISNLK